MEKNLEIVERLFSLGLIRATNISELRETASKNGRELLEEAFVSGLISIDAMPFVFSERFDLPFMVLQKGDIELSLSEAVPAELAWGERIVPISSSEEQITIGVINPFKPMVFSELERITGKKVRLVMVSESSMTEILNNLYHSPLDFKGEEISGFLASEIDFPRFASTCDSQALVSDILYLSRIAGVSLMLLHQIFGKFIIEGERGGEKLVLLESSREMGEFILSGLRKLSGADNIVSPLFEKIIESGDGPRSGMFKVTIVSGAGSTKAVVKIVPNAIGKFSMDTIGLDEEQTGVLKRLLEREGGLYLVGSPSYEGVTTTLYSMVRYLHQSDLRAVAIEEDIRFKNEGFIQIEKGMLGEDVSIGGLVRSFSPDMLLIDNVDAEQLFTELDQLAGSRISLFAGVRISSMEDIINRALEPKTYTVPLSSYIKAIIFQLLVRILCDVCKKEIPTFPYGQMLGDLDDYERGHFLKNIKYYLPGGCDQCGGTGYSGKSALFDIVTFPYSVRLAVLTGRSREERLSGLLSHSRMSPEDRVINMLVEGKVTIEESLPFVRSFVTGKQSG